MRPSRSAPRLQRTGLGSILTGACAAGCTMKAVEEVQRVAHRGQAMAVHRAMESMVAEKKGGDLKRSIGFWGRRP